MRIFVTGPTGSGKTTLAARLGDQIGSPVHTLDDIHWVRHPSGDRRREPEERLQLLERLVRRNAWIIEGVQFKWADAAMSQADLIVVLDVPRWRNISRILRRFTVRRLSTAPSPRGTVAALREEMGWSADYHSHERAMLFEKVARWPDKVHIVRGQRDMDAITVILPGSGTR